MQREGFVITFDNGEQLSNVDQKLSKYWNYYILTEKMFHNGKHEKE